MTIHELRALRAKAFDAYKALAEKKEFKKDVDQPELEKLEKEVKDFDEQIKRALNVQALEATTTAPVAGQERSVPAAAENDRYIKEPSLVVGGVCKMLGAGGGNLYGARQAAKDVYGESHPVTKALITSTGTGGGFIVAPDQMNEIIELLRPKAVVRGAPGIRNIPMPRGTMTLPGQASAASAGYGSEVGKIKSSQQTLNQIVASYKKLTALVPVSNDMMRYADPAVDAFVRDDLIKVIALAEDYAFLLEDGTGDTPRGYLSFANGYAVANGGTAGSWSSGANSVFATGGNFITSNPTFTLDTVNAEAAGAISRLDDANVPDDKRMWFMNPRSKNYLYNLLNELGLYVYRDEMNKGLWLGYPFRTTTQLPRNLWDEAATNKDLQFIILAEMTETMILDSMQMELAVSREGSYVDGNGNTISAFQNDQTLIRAIEEHDFQLRHDAAVAVIQGVRWAPATT